MAASAKMASGSGKRPLAAYPSAKKPSAGSITNQPSAASVAKLRTTAGLVNITSFMAGAIIFLAVEAIMVAVGASSANPLANLPIMFAVAGTTKMISAHLAQSICTTSVVWPANKSVSTSCPDRIASVLLVINSCADCVIATRTWA